MGFFKKLFSRGESFVPTPTQTVPGLDPIIVQAIENLYPNPEAQKQVFDYCLNYKEKFKDHGHGENLALLAVLKLSEGKIERLIDLNSPYVDQYQYWFEEIYPVLPNKKAAEQWVKSITKS